MCKTMNSLQSLIDSLVESIRNAHHVPSDIERKEAIAQIKSCAETLQKSLCCYLTTEGDGRTCDCKFASAGEERLRRGTSEQTGCCEARSILWNLKTLQTVPDIEQALKAVAVAALEMAREAGPEERTPITHHNEGFNSALSAKSQAISELISEVRK